MEEEIKEQLVTRTPTLFKYFVIYTQEIGFNCKARKCVHAVLNNRRTAVEFNSLELTKSVGNY